MVKGKQTPKKIFIAPLNWGLGHATRLLPLIRIFLNQGHAVFIAASGRSENFLKQEVAECTFLNFPEYPIKYPRSRFFVTRFMLIIFPQMLLAMWREKRALKSLQLEHGFDLIISDNRFSLAMTGIKSILISHQLRYKLPWPMGKMEWLPELFNYSHFKKYDKIIVPDVDGPDSLTGELAHNMRYLAQDRLYYSGTLTDLNADDPVNHEVVNFFVIISGPEPQRTYFEKLMLDQIEVLGGRVVVALGIPEKKYKIRMGNADIFTFLNRKELFQCMKISEFIISRPGYTTVMEMVELQKKGMFIPTPGQVEQVYLAKYYTERGWCYSVDQENLDLSAAVKVAMTYSGFPGGYPPAKRNLQILSEKLLHN
jgi:uncharacterized protein (TIGR00661 family)